MSRMWTNGRHGRPSLSIRITFSVQAWPGEIVHHEVEAHPRRSPERGRVAQERRREVIGRERRHVPLDQHLAFGVRGQRLDLRGLDAVRRAGRAVHAARRHVDEALDPGLPGQRGEPHAAEVVDLERDLRIQRTDRVVRQLGQVDDRVVPAQILDSVTLPDVLRNPRRRPIDAVVQPAAAMEPGVDPGHVVSTIEQVGAQDRADVALAAGHQHAHQLSPPWRGNRLAQVLELRWIERNHAMVPPSAGRPDGTSRGAEAARVLRSHRSDRTATRLHTR